jgi:hypothetical protein
MIEGNHTISIVLNFLPTQPSMIDVPEDVVDMKLFNKSKQ